jgi:pimeloyl-ACP methyl ester carboxylesterase
MTNDMRIPRLAVAFWFLLLAEIGPSAAQPPGELFDLGGFRLHLHCFGEGRPVVVLDSGLGGAASDWRKVQPELARTNRTCVYDRAGYGWSDSGPLPRTSGRMAAELRTLLMLAELPPPYLVVGHSFGGYNARMFAGLFPGDTAGVVLVDTPHEALVDALSENGLMRLLDPEGRLLALWSPDLFSGLPAELGVLAELFGGRGKTWGAIFNEAAGFNRSGEELSDTPLPPDLPLGVLMHGRRIFPAGSVGDGLEREWLQANRDLAAAQRRSLVRIATDSGHFIHADQPESIVEMVRLVDEMTDSRP